MPLRFDFMPSGRQPSGRCRNAICKPPQRLHALPHIQLFNSALHRISLTNGRRHRRCNRTFCESSEASNRQPSVRATIMKYSLSRFSVDPNRIKAARHALAKLVASVHKHDPEVAYLVFQEPGQPVFFTLVSFQDDAVYRRHATSAHVAQFARAILPLCTGTPTFVGVDLVKAARRGAAGRKLKLPRSQRPHSVHKAAVQLANRRRSRA